MQTELYKLTTNGPIDTLAQFYALEYLKGVLNVELFEYCLLTDNSIMLKDITGREAIVKCRPKEQEIEILSTGRDPLIISGEDYRKIIFKTSK